MSRALFLLKNAKLNKLLLNVGLLGFPFVLPLPTPLNIKSICYIVFLTTVFFSTPLRTFNYKKIFFNKIIALFLALYLLDPFLSIVRGDGFYVRDLRLSFFIVPILFLHGSIILARYKKKILIAFVAGTFGYILIAIVYVAYFYTNSIEVFAFDYFLKYVTYYYLPYSIHHTYIGVYICFSVAVTLFVFKFRAYLKIILCLIMFLSALIIASKLTILILAIIFFIYLITELKWSFLKKLVLLSVFGGAFFVLLAILYLYSDLFRTLHVSVFERLNLFKCSIKGILTNISIGIGNYNVKSYIANCNTDLGKQNTHNIFLEEWLSNGIIGLLTFMFVLYKLGKSFLKNRSALGVILIALLLLFGFVEHLFNLQYGVLFFMYFLMLAYCPKKPKSYKEKPKP